MEKIDESLDLNKILGDDLKEGIKFLRRNILTSENGILVLYDKEKAILVIMITDREIEKIKSFDLDNNKIMFRIERTIGKTTEYVSRTFKSQEKIFLRLCKRIHITDIDKYSIMDKDGNYLAIDFEYKGHIKANLS